MHDLIDPPRLLMRRIGLNPNPQLSILNSQLILVARFPSVDRRNTRWF
jgi:hypothetical protein